MRIRGPAAFGSPSSSEEISRWDEMRPEHLRRCLEFLNKNAYMDVAIRSTWFCTAARNALKMIMQEAALMSLLNGQPTGRDAAARNVISRNTPSDTLSKLDAPQKRGLVHCETAFRNAPLTQLARCPGLESAQPLTACSAINTTRKATMAYPTVKYLLFHMFYAMHLQKLLESNEMV